MAKSAPAYLPFAPLRCSSSGCLSVSNLVPFIQLLLDHGASFLELPFDRLERRLNQDATSEFRTALDEVNRIALFRLQEL